MMPTIASLVLSLGNSVQAIMPKAAWIAWCTSLQTLLAATKLRLFQEPFVADEFSSLADLNAAVATFDGYDAEDITSFSAPLYDPEGGASTNSGVVTFPYIDDVAHAGNTVNGWYLTSSDGTILFGCGNFASPVIVQTDGDGVQLIVEVNVGAS